jgi:pimeloyl-ACP methyl ester carboxylesterase
VVSLPVVLVPGLYGTPRLYADQLPALWRSGPVTVADHTRHDDIDAIAAHVLSTAPPRFALAGLSMGGYVALAIHRAAPERIDRLALLDTQATADDDEQRAMRRRNQGLEREGRADEVLDGSWPILVHPDRQGDHALKEVVRGMRAATGDDAAVRQLQAIMDRPDARPQLPGIAVPTLVLVGDGDRLTPPERARELADAIPDARLAVVPGAGHLSALERPEAVTRELVAWLGA